MWRKRPPGGTILALAALGVLGAACGRHTEPPLPPSPSPPRLVTEYPAGRAGPTSAPLEPHTRYPDGTHLALEDARGKRTPLELNLAAAGGPEPALDGERVLFVGKGDASEKYGIWSCQEDGTDLRRVVEVNADCGRAAQLPDGRLVYSRAVPGRPVGSLRSAWALYVKSKDERDGRRITFGIGCAIDPAVLADGRILYVDYQPETTTDGRLVGGMWLWTVHPDGTGAARVPGRAEPGGGVPVFPYHAGSGAVVCGILQGDVLDGWYVIDWRAPGEEPRRLVRGTTPPGRRLDRAQGHLSMVRANVPYGQVVGLDAGEGARAVRFHVLEDTGVNPPSRWLGEVPLAEDGSFFVRLPPDVPLALETLDVDGNVIGEQKAPFWVRPNETRACVGCHEDPETAPPNRRPLAVLEDPVDLTKEGPR